MSRAPGPSGHRRNRSAGPADLRGHGDCGGPRASAGAFLSEGRLDACPRGSGSLAGKRPAALSLEPLVLAPAPPPPPPPQSRASRSIDVAFDNLFYSVPIGFFRRDVRNILAGVSGELRAGELTAIVGPSGAGKSTLMDILAGYISTWTGSISVNGAERDLRRFRRQACYIMQDDHLQPLLTVQEAMHSAAELKLGPDVSQKQKQHKIKSILDAIGLYETRKTRTGSLSGGQRKRLAIALELVSNPPVMFFDEPTSGLDSSTSKHCIALLRQLASDGRTVVCTIHQPSALLLEMFDHLYALADGKCIYQGSTKGLVPYLGELGLQCPPYHNPADFFLEVATGEYGSHLNSLVTKIENGKNDSWRKPRVDTPQINAMMHIDKMMANGFLTPIRAPVLPLTPFSPAPPNSVNNPLSTSKKPSKRKIVISPSAYCKDDYRYPTSFIGQVTVLMLRNIKILTRDRVLTYMRFIIHSSIALMMGVLYFQIGKDAQFTLDNFNFVFFTIMFLMFTAFNSMMLTFPLELPIITREHFNRWYSLKAYYVAITLSDAPIQFISTLFYAVITYIMTGQPIELFRIWYFAVICILVSFVAQGIGLLNGAIFNIQNGVIFGPLFMLPFTIFSGFFVHLHDAHPYLQWLFHISFLKYGLEGAMLSIFGYSRGKLSCSSDYCHFRFPSRFLVEVDMEYANYSYCVIALCSLCIFLRILTYFTLYYRLRHRRN